MVKSEIIRSFIYRHIKVTIVISVIAGILSYFLISLFPSMEYIDAELISSSWPRIMIDLFGDPIYAFTDIYAWMHLQLFHITLWVFFGIFASLLASDIVAKEIEDRSMDILLSTPITRTGLILSRLIGIIIILAASMLPVILGCVLGILTSSFHLSIDLILLTIAILLLLSLVFAAVTLLISIFIPKQTYSIVITTGIFGFMFLYEELLVKIVPFLSKFAFLSPFHYFKPQDILIYNSFSFLDPIILLLVFTVLSLISMFIFTRKDILL